MPPSSERRCVTCRWWDGYGAPRIGDCHRYAPSPAFWAVWRRETRRNRDGVGAMAWVETTNDGWCGEWAAREESPDAT